MKKFLAVLLSLVLAFSFCVVSFAEDTSSDTTTTTQASGASDALSQLQKILTILQNGGSLEDLTPEEKEQLKTALDGVIFKTDDKGEVVTNESGKPVTSTLASVVSQLITKNSDYAEAVANLNKMRDGGILSDAAYAVIIDKIEEQSSVDASLEESRLAAGDEPTTNAIDGIKDFFGTIFDKIGGLVGGGSDSSTTTTTKKSGSSSDDSFSNTKTGDVALFSVAGVALAAGLALVLTKKKEK